MPSSPPNSQGKPSIESICLFGAEGTGKSRAVFEIALWHQNRGSDATFYVVDTDNSYERMMLPGSEYHDLENLVVWEATDWSEALDAAKEAKAKATSREDWIIMDRYGILWGWVQDHFIEMMFGKAGKNELVADYWEMARKQTSDARLDGYKDWQYINKIWHELSVRTLHRAKCNVLTICTEVMMQDKGGSFADSAKNYEDFGRMNHKPDGQKGIPSDHHTVIRMVNKGRGRFEMTAARDRQPRDAQDLQGVDVGNFWLPYLVQKAKWTI